MDSHRNTSFAVMIAVGKALLVLAATRLGYYATGMAFNQAYFASHPERAAFTLSAFGPIVSGCAAGLMTAILFRRAPAWTGSVFAVLMVLYMWFGRHDWALTSGSVHWTGQRTTHYVFHYDYPELASRLVLAAAAGVVAAAIVRVFRARHDQHRRPTDSA